MKLILARATTHLRDNLPFVIYKKPDDTNIIGLFQNTSELFQVQNFDEKGFAFASFDGSKLIIIPENKSIKIVDSFVSSAIAFKPIAVNSAIESSKDNFETLVSKGIEAIYEHKFQKVVLSRKEAVEVQDFDIIKAFEKLVNLYPSSFGYCFYHPKIGSWLGATPEQLLQVNDVVFETISLAGTQKDSGVSEVIWTEKERDEQQFVTDYIVEKLKDIAFDVSVSNPYSTKAGSLWHIKTDISGLLNSGKQVQELIQLLHPTPAVCGFPKDSAKLFIVENESYDRSFYTGFLGELNIDDKSNLFVNLRCMEIIGTHAHLFMGCGITKNSIPQKEWEESCNKSLTMKSIL